MISIKSPPVKMVDKINSEKIDWDYLSMNPKPIRLLEKNFDKINWCFLSINHRALNLSEGNLDKIEWYYLSKMNIREIFFHESECYSFIRIKFG